MSVVNGQVSAFVSQNTISVPSTYASRCERAAAESVVVCAFDSIKEDIGRVAAWCVRTWEVITSHGVDDRLHTARMNIAHTAITGLTPR